MDFLNISRNGAALGDRIYSETGVVQYQRKFAARYKINAISGHN